MHAPHPAARVVRFGVFELDAQSGELRRHGLKVRLPEQSFQILNLLLSRPGEVVTREELRHVLWTPDTFVDFDIGLNSAIRKLRDALDDSADNPRFVETLPRRGYRFIAPVNAPTADVLPASSSDAEKPSHAPIRVRAAWLASAVLLVATTAALGLAFGRAARTQHRSTSWIR
ncbi:MAG: winged helix-turn-helix domain-containing protein [Acidobacteria bacterium]|nr:winged helix-turn-helix domain-containing protein [Acidobacteriota bacterium]